MLWENGIHVFYRLRLPRTAPRPAPPRAAAAAAAAAAAVVAMQPTVLKGRMGMKFKAAGNFKTIAVLGVALQSAG